MQKNENAHFASLRQQMVQQQLIDEGILDTRVLEAMGTVPREEFVPPPFRHLSYEDGPLSIGEGQTISQPFTVAFMCQALQLTGHEKVLEIGTGSGYSAAVLSLLARKVCSIERIPVLATGAQRKLQKLGYQNVHVTLGDGTIGLPNEAPFDAMIVTAGGCELPAPYADQLAEGGRILIPIGHSQRTQEMMRFTKRHGCLMAEPLGRFAFVPLVGQFGWGEHVLSECT